jgi:hypothetical protein
MRSKYSNRSSHKKAMSMTQGQFKPVMENIDEKDELFLVNNQGMKLNLNDE